MDIDLFRTFLEVNRTRHFGRAAENLFLTQSAISARIRLLEETLGVTLFTRERNDIRLTPAGNRLIKYAESIINTWNRARQDAVLKAEDTDSLAIGGMFSLWDIVLQGWLHQLHREMPGLALQVDAASEDVLVRRLLDAVLDVAFMWEPPQMAELELEEIGSIRLVLVSSKSGQQAADALGEGYIRVDWGTAFSIAHSRNFPDAHAPRITTRLARFGLSLLLESGGAAYLAEPMVDEHLRAGRLHRVLDAPVIDRAFHAVFRHSLDARRPLVEHAIAMLRRSSAEHHAIRATSA